MAGEYKIPFDQYGNQLHTIYRWYNDPIDWRDNSPFETTLHFSDVWNWAVFHTDAGHKVYMGMTEFARIVPFLDHGKLKGKFKFKKTGQVYNIVMIDE